jgi:hypothetical protein
MGFITRLITATDDITKAFGKSPVTISRKKDAALCEVFKHLPVADVMKHFTPGLELTNLRATFQMTLLIKAGDEVSCNQQSFLEFHQLVIATFLGYRNTLLTLACCRGLDAEKEAAARDVWNFAHLLWRIAHSRLLRLYLTALSGIGALVLPDRKEEKAYRYVIEQAGPERKRVKEIPDEEERAGSCMWTPSEETEEDEQQRLMNDDADVLLTFLRWARLQVNHFAALNILSAHPKKATFQNVQITLIAANQRRPEPSEKEPWMDTIRKLTQVSSSGANTFDAEDAIKSLQKRIETLRENEPDIMRRFRNWDDAVPGGVHCEAALAALAAFPHLAIHPEYDHAETLHQIVKVCSELHS